MSDLGDFNPDPAEGPNPEPTRSEPADFGGGESTGVQDLLGGDDTADESDMPTEPQRLEETMQETETTHTVNESADKIVLTTNVKRGTGTRDEDKIRVKVKGEKPQITAAKLADTLAALENHGVAEQLRGTQAGDDE